ncbi:hypothetical protein [Streptomyces sp. NPDC007205]|uniref:hypothetical protein n=1 Tax=Streptomyces sp. NPDC007205 TaxID=3154316 RepID=UPI0033DBE6A5
MPESVPVRCPACRREHVYTAPVYPCACGAPTAPRLDPAAEPVVAAHRAWDDEWIAVPCAACGRPGQWPHPELGCSCGTVLRVPVAETPPPDSAMPSTKGGMRSTDSRIPAPGTPMRSTNGSMLATDNGMPSTDGGMTSTDGGMTSTDGGMTSTDGSIPSTDGSMPSPVGRPDASPSRPAFQPRAIRTARDAVTVAALYLRWLGYRDIRRADQRPPNGIGLAAHGLLAQVDPTVRPAAPRDVECLWLTAMTESADCVYFSLAGYTDDARVRANTLGIPLFVLDLAGVPQPVNDHADALNATGAPEAEPRSRGRQS